MRLFALFQFDADYRINQIYFGYSVISRSFSSCMPPWQLRSLPGIILRMGIHGWENTFCWILLIIVFFVKWLLIAEIVLGSLLLTRNMIILVQLFSIKLQSLSIPRSFFNFSRFPNSRL